MTQPVIPQSTPLPAGLGVRLWWTDKVVMCQAMELNAAAPTMPPIELPRLPSSLVERCAGLCRGVWNQQKRCVVVLLYVDLINRRWMDLIPPQMCAPTDVRSRVGEHLLPGMGNWRLAGSFTSRPTESGDSADAVPPFDGIHVIHDPGREWIHLRCHLHCQDVTTRVAAAQAIWNEAETNLAQLQRFFQFVNEL